MLKICDTEIAANTPFFHLSFLYQTFCKNNTKKALFSHSGTIYKEVTLNGQ